MIATKMAERKPEWNINSGNQIDGTELCKETAEVLEEDMWKW